jgi:hypothetical protein
VHLPGPGRSIVRWSDLGRQDKKTGKICTSVEFQTCSLPCFGELYNLFYLEGKKVIPSNIGDLLTPSGLAYWIADDGGFEEPKRRVTLSTNSFSFDEVNLLLGVLNDKFNLKCYINKHKPGHITPAGQDRSI